MVERKMSHGCFSNVFSKISLHSLIAQLKVKGLDIQLWFSLAVQENILNEAKSQTSSLHSAA